MGQYKNVADVRNLEVQLLQQERARLENAENELCAFISDNNDTTSAVVPHTISIEDEEGDNGMQQTSKFSPN